MYAIESKDGPRAKWKQSRFGRPYPDLHAAIAAARDLDEHGGCVVRVVQPDTGEVVWTPRYDRVS